jgi:hypothetical protein
MDAYAAYHQGPYGSINAVVGGKPTMAKMKSIVEGSKRPPFAALAGMVFVPWVIFVVVYYLRSFDIHYQAEGMCNICCFAFVVPVAFFAYMTFNLASSGGDPVPMAILTVVTLVCWVAGNLTGEMAFTNFMRPFYELSELNTYPRINPTKWQGSQLMDAGVIQFMEGSHLNLQTSMGFKNDDVYCVAPVVFRNETTQQPVPQDIFDFWAVGINCCSGHVPDFQCGEYSNPMARSGLRVMDSFLVDARENYRLAVKEAEAAFNIQAPHPIFLHWMMDPQAEVNAYKEDGARYFQTACITTFAVLSALVIAVGFFLHWAR